MSSMDWKAIIPVLLPFLSQRPANREDQEKLRKMERNTNDIRYNQRRLNRNIIEKIDTLVEQVNKECKQCKHHLRIRAAQKHKLDRVYEWNRALKNQLVCCRIVILLFVLILGYLLLKCYY